MITQEFIKQVRLLNQVTSELLEEVQFVDDPNEELVEAIGKLSELELAKTTADLTYLLELS